MDFDYVNLSKWTVLRVSGPDSLNYLNGIVSFDLEKLDGTIRRCAFLNPQAKIRSIFWIENKEDEYWIYAPPEMKENLIEDLLKFKLSMDVKLEDVTDEIPPLVLGKSKLKLEGLYLKNSNFSFSIDLKTQDLKSINYDQFKLELIKNGVLTPELAIDQNPYEIGMNDMISLEKGCFLGQEPISRMFHRGKPRKLIYFINFKNQIDDKKISIQDINMNILEIKEIGNEFYGFAFINYGADISKLKSQSDDFYEIRLTGNYPNFIR